MRPSNDKCENATLGKYALNRDKSSTRQKFQIQYIFQKLTEQQK